MEIKQILPLIVIFSLSIFKNTRDSNFINYNEFGKYFIFILPILYYNTKVFSILSYINRNYSEDELLTFLNKNGFTEKDIRKTRRKVNLINDLEEDGVNTANITIKPYLNKGNNAKYIKEILPKVNKDNLLKNLNILDMELSKDCLNDIIENVKNELSNIR